MARAEKNDKVKRFCNKYKIHTADYNKAKEIDKERGRDLDNYIGELTASYENYSKSCETITREILMNKILSDKALKDIHSARYRMKSTESLVGKIIKKKAVLSKDISTNYDLEKYRDLDENNYYKIITDISGVRILTRYRAQLEVVHNWIWEKYFLGEEYYLKNFVKDYTANPKHSFIVEQPKAYYRDETDLELYKSFGKDIFDFRKSDKGYNSIHYLINTDGKYVEIQLRTIWDEAWSECTHDVVYKCKKTAAKYDLERLSRCLAQQTISAESLATFMYEKAYGVPKNKKTLSETKTNTKTDVSEPSIDIKGRIKKLNETRVEFDGNIDSLGKI